jgi:hypothetical protein
MYSNPADYKAIAEQTATTATAEMKIWMTPGILTA